MDAVLAVVRHPFVPRRQARLELAGVGDPLLVTESRPLVGLGRAVLRQLGQREVRPGRDERGLSDFVLERLQPGEVGPERHDPEVGLVPEDGEAQDLVRAVGDEPIDGVEHALGRPRFVLGPGPVDAGEEVQDAPTGGRFDGFHAS